MPFVELPFDILDIIFSYLDAKSFLAVCSTCKPLNEPTIRLNPTYWRETTRETFRVPNRPVTHGDGPRWQKLYRRLLTQSRVYTWGNADHGALGHAHLQRQRAEAGRQAMVPTFANVRSHESWPTEMEHSRDVGTVADMQAGGWSTTILNSKGALYTVGRMDQLRTSINHGPIRPRRVPSAPGMELGPLRYPAGFPSPVERWDPSTAIRQFSSGRAHVLGLSDSGRIWSWDHEKNPGFHIRFLHTDTKEQTEADQSVTAGSVTRVVAGWDKSSAYIIGNGILIWNVAHLTTEAHPPNDNTLEGVDTLLVHDSVTIPRTAYRRPKGQARDPDVETQALGEEIGEVVNWIVLENFIVLVTDIGKAFTAKFKSNDNNPLSVSAPLEITELQTRSPSGSIGKDDFILDVQGSFRRFAVFKRSGEVLIADTTLLSLVYEAHHGSTSLVTVPPPAPKKIPALQNTGVVSLAFGDYHMHALHAAGHITSYGTEPQSCGALGLGGHHGNPEARLRGIRAGGPMQDGKLLPQCYASGRRVWFEQEKRAWITFIASGGVDPDEAKERMRMSNIEPSVQAEVSEWIEQRGNHWYGDGSGDNTQDQETDGENDGLGAYFALSVTAAGWHSGALVLVNEDLAEKSRQRCIVSDPDPETETANPNTSHDEQPVPSTSAHTATAAPQQGPEQANGWSSPASALVTSALTTLTTWSRWFLGLPSPAGAASAGATPAFRPLVLPPLVGQIPPFTDPTVHGASPEPGYKYVWAGEPFPRLRLGDGREMPGLVEFAEWPWGERPDLGVGRDVEV